MKKLKLVYLENCPYSIALKELLDRNKIKYILEKITSKTKEQTKKKYNIETFPQLYYIINDINIGGYDKSSEFINNVNSITSIDDIKKLYESFNELTYKEFLILICNII
jgi:glutaredoxin